MISKKETPSKFRKSFSSKEGRTFSRDGKPSSKDGKSFSRDGKSFSRDSKSFSRDGKSFSKEERPFSKERRVGRRDFPKGNGMGPLVKKVEDDGTVRLNKYVANTGLCSRRDAD